MDRMATRRNRLISAALAGVILALLAAPSPIMAETAVDRVTVDINSAEVAQLSSLPGIGEAKARAIVAFREANGPYESVEDLLSVRGIGMKLLDRIRSLVRVSTP